MNMNPSADRQTISRWLLAGAALSCLFQLLWFGSRCLHQIDIDGMDYTGIARHLHNGQWYAAINDFRSPLFSWMIAAGSFFDGNLVHVGKMLNILSFLACAGLLYCFTNSLWGSRLAASIAVLWFSLCRGLTAVAVEMVTPDLLLAAAVLLYFLVLLRCLRGGGNRYWVLLGAAHALAYLTKAFALPWLALCTIVAVLFSPPPRRWASRICLAAAIPLLIAGMWAGVLHSKYGVLTIGTQFKANFLEWTVRAYDNPPNRKFVILNDDKTYRDEYGVNDPMPPGTWPWRYRFNPREAVAKLAASEVRNLPKAVKELLIVITPGGLLAFALVLGGLVKYRLESSVEYTMAVVIAFGVVTLCLAYCMLVFDGRYLYPVIPLVMAVSVGLLLTKASALRSTAAALLVIGLVISMTYSSSPFRKLDRDFQISCYRAGELLRIHPGTTAASIGLGPYPEHGVGWEAGYKAAYFGDRWLIAATDQVPGPDKTAALLDDLSKAAPDAVLIWGRANDAQYKDLVRQIVLRSGEASVGVLTDPSVGEVGTAVFFHQR
jgi:hypothetical protein